MQSNRDKLLNWLQADAVTNDNLPLLVNTMQAKPEIDHWQSFTKQALLWLSILCTSVGVIFFFAYNWQELSRIHRFALIEAAMLVCSLCFLRFSSQVYAKIALLMGMTLLTGSLLALVGQTYQTGADPWQLFAVWAALVTPWAILARSSVHWIFWTILINTALLLYIEVSQQFLWFYSYNKDSSLLLLATINTSLLILFELHHYYIINKNGASVTNRYTQQVLFAAACLFISIWGMSHSFDHSQTNEILIYAAWLAVGALIYRFVIQDLLCIVICFVSFLILSTYHLVSSLDNSNLEGILLLSAVYIIGASTVIGQYLKKLIVIFNQSTQLCTQNNQHQENRNG